MVLKWRAGIWERSKTLYISRILSWISSSAPHRAVISFCSDKLKVGSRTAFSSKIPGVNPSAGLEANGSALVKRALRLHGLEWNAWRILSARGFLGEGTTEYSVFISSPFLLILMS